MPLERVRLILGDPHLELVQASLLYQWRHLTRECVFDVASAFIENYPIARLHDFPTLSNASSTSVTDATISLR